MGREASDMKQFRLCRRDAYSYHSHGVRTRSTCVIAQHSSRAVFAWAVQLFVGKILLDSVPNALNGVEEDVLYS
jgi:hypothetical protein